MRDDRIFSLEVTAAALVLALLALAIALLR
jgi:hypothetical protein